MPILKESKNIPSKVIWVTSATTDTFLMLYRLHEVTSCPYTENTNQQLLMINEIGADVFKAGENTEVHIQIELF